MKLIMATVVTGMSLLSHATYAGEKCGDQKKVEIKQTEKITSESDAEKKLERIERLAARERN